MPQEPRYHTLIYLCRNCGVRFEREFVFGPDLDDPRADEDRKYAWAALNEIRWEHRLYLQATHPCSRNWEVRGRAALDAGPRTEPDPAPDGRELHMGLADLVAVVCPPGDDQKNPWDHTRRRDS